MAAASLLLLSCTPQTFITEPFPGCFQGETYAPEKVKNGSGETTVKDSLEMSVKLDSYGTRAVLADHNIFDLYRMRFREGDQVSLVFTTRINGNSADREQRSEDARATIRTSVREHSFIRLSEALGSRVRLNLVKRGGCST